MSGRLPEPHRRLNFDAEGADFNSPATFNVVNYTVNNPRLIQFGLKLAF
jgi:hypothetical protein